MAHNPQAPPIPGIQGQLPGRLQLMLDALGQGIQEDPLGAAELATSPIPVVGDVIGTVAGVERFVQDPSIEEAIFTSLGIAPFVSGAMIKDIMGPRLKQLIKEFNKKDAEIVQASGQQVKLDTAINQVDDAQTIFRSLDIPADVDIDEVTRAGLKKRMQKRIDAISIEDPFTGQLTTARELGGEGLLDMRAQLRKKGKALEMKRGILEKEFDRLAGLKESLSEGVLRNERAAAFKKKIDSLGLDPKRPK